MSTWSSFKSSRFLTMPSVESSWSSRGPTACRDQEEWRCSAWSLPASPGAAWPVVCCVPVSKLSWGTEPSSDLNFSHVISPLIISRDLLLLPYGLTISEGEAEERERYSSPTWPASVCSMYLLWGNKQEMQIREFVMNHPSISQHYHHYKPNPQFN